VIFSKKTLEENNYDLRKVLNIPGTGPFKTQRREIPLWGDLNSGHQGSDFIR
jgi:hypothetical protein